MNILHIATKDSGGAGIAGLRIHQALKQCSNKNINSKALLLWNNNTQDLNANSVILYEEQFKIGKKMGDYLSYGLNRLFNPTLFSKRWIKNNHYTSFYYPENHSLIQWADIIHLHWVNGFVNPFRFIKKVKKPIVWTFHDMTPFTGGNCYESGIFKNNLNLFDSYLSKKTKLFSEHKNIYGHATTNEFMKLAVNKYKTIKQEKCFSIPHPLNTESYQYIDKKKARILLNIETTKKTLLFVAADANNERKGARFLLNKNIFKEYFVIIVGQKNSAFEKIKNCIQLGYLTQEQLQLAYSAADFFVTPAIEEAFGQTAIEALYCGTPIIAFKTAGAKQIIIENENGVIADDISSSELFNAIQKADNIAFDYKEISRKAKEIYAPNIIADQLLKSYQTILANYNG